MPASAPHADGFVRRPGGGSGPAGSVKGGRTLLIACGALAREIVWLTRVNRWTHLTVACLPAHYHNTPQLIPDAVRRKIHGARGRFAQIYVLYADCGTGGLLDAVLAEERVERIAGPHCYSFFAGAAEFDAMMDDEPGSFFLTDYLTRHFERLVIQGLGIDRHPELLRDYFGNYKRLVYLAQTDDPDLTAMAEKAAARLGLAFERRFTGFGELADFLTRTSKDPHGDADHRLLA